VSDTSFAITLMKSITFVGFRGYFLTPLIPLIHADKARCVRVPQKQNGTSKLDKLHCEMLDRRGLQRGLQQVQQWDATHME